MTGRQGQAWLTEVAAIASLKLPSNVKVWSANNGQEQAWLTGHAMEKGLRRQHAKSLQNGGALAAIQTILTKRIHMHPIGQTRMHRRVVKTPMTPTKYIRNGFQDTTKILVKYRCSPVEKRHSNARYHFAHTDTRTKKVSRSKGTNSSISEPVTSGERLARSFVPSSKITTWGDNEETMPRSRRSFATVRPPTPWK